MPDWKANCFTWVVLVVSVALVLALSSCRGQPLRERYTDMSPYNMMSGPCCRHGYSLLRACPWGCYRR